MLLEVLSLAIVLRTSSLYTLLLAVSVPLQPTHLSDCSIAPSSPGSAVRRTLSASASCSSVILRVRLYHASLDSPSGPWAGVISVCLLDWRRNALFAGVAINAELPISVEPGRQGYFDWIRCIGPNDFRHGIRSSCITLPRDSHSGRLTNLLCQSGRSQRAVACLKESSAKAVSGQTWKCVPAAASHGDGQAPEFACSFVSSPRTCAA
jgi:hypothetical protein